MTNSSSNSLLIMVGWPDHVYVTIVRGRSYCGGACCFGRCCCRRRFCCCSALLLLLLLLPLLLPLLLSSVVFVFLWLLCVVCLCVVHGSADQSMDEQTINREIMNNKQQQSLTTPIMIPMECGPHHLTLFGQRRWISTRTHLLHRGAKAKS